MSGAALLSLTGRVDVAGRLVEAAPRLLEMFQRAGSAPGDPIALPEVAGLVRLAQRLGIAIDRTIVVADGDDDVELRVRADPDADGVTLHVGGWQPHRAWHDDTPTTAGATDEDADWQWWSDAALRLVRIGGRDETDASLGRPVSQVFLFETDDAQSAMVARSAFSGQPARLAASGQQVLVSAVPHRDAHGRFAGYAGAVRMPDDAPAPPDSSDSSVAGLAGHLDRALRLPLERIVANASSMSAGVEGPIGESYAGYADDIASAGRHLLGLVTDLVDLEAIERADFAVEPEPIDLADVARRAAGLLAVRASEAGVRIERPGSDDALPATGDFRRALQVMVNLIANALRYSSQDGVVWVRVERDGEQVRAIVADQGKGIAAVDHAMIFEKFGRVDPGEAGGSGLGLYISRRLARAMGGDLSVDSAPGQGARFAFSIPAG